MKEVNRACGAKAQGVTLSNVSALLSHFLAQENGSVSWRSIRNVGCAMKRALMACLFLTACNEASVVSDEPLLRLHEVDRLGQMVGKTALKRPCRTILDFDRVGKKPLLVFDPGYGLVALWAHALATPWFASASMTPPDSFAIDGKGGGSLTRHSYSDESGEASIRWLDARGEVTDELKVFDGNRVAVLHDHATASGKLFAVGHKSLRNADLLISNEAWLVAINEEHELLWERSINHGMLREGMKAVAVAQDGDLLIAGYVEETFPGPFQAVAYRVTEHGALAWRTSVPVVDSVATEVLEWHGVVFVAGHAFDQRSTDRPSDAWVSAISANGIPLWSMRFDYALYDSATAITTTDEGVLLVAVGETLVALDPDSGRELWTRTLSEPIGALLPSESGAVIAATCR